MNSLLDHSGLKDTQPRRLIAEALRSTKKTATPADLQRQLAVKKIDLNIVTIYRVLDAFEKAGIVHKHPCNGSFSLCSIPEKKGHHGFLHCTSCDSISEFADERLCAIENTIAREAKFQPDGHVSEVVGTCSSCH